MGKYHTRRICQILSTISKMEGGEEKSEKGGEEMTERDRDIARRFLFAESQSHRDQYRPKEKKKDWLTTHCIHCDYRIQYIPKEGYQGQLKCPDCGKIFDVPADDQKSKGVTLDDFSKEKRRK